MAWNVTAIATVILPLIIFGIGRLINRDEGDGGGEGHRRSLPVGRDLGAAKVDEPQAGEGILAGDQAESFPEGV